MLETTSFKRLILRTVLRQVSPMVIRLVSVSDQIAAAREGVAGFVETITTQLAVPTEGVP